MGVQYAPVLVVGRARTRGTQPDALQQLHRQMVGRDQPRRQRRGPPPAPTWSAWSMGVLGRAEAMRPELGPIACANPRTHLIAAQEEQSQPCSPAAQPRPRCFPLCKQTRGGR